MAFFEDDLSITIQQVCLQEGEAQVVVLLVGEEP
jgi:hypothetical protein